MKGFKSTCYEIFFGGGCMRNTLEDVSVWRYIFSLAMSGIFRLGIARPERDGTRAETRFPLSSKRTSPFKSVGTSVQSTAGSRGVRISLSNAGYTTFGDSVRVLATHSIRQFPLHFPTRASPCATRFRTSSTSVVLMISEALYWTTLIACLIQTTKKCCRPLKDTDSINIHVH